MCASCLFWINKMCPLKCYSIRLRKLLKLVAISSQKCCEICLPVLPHYEWVLNYWRRGYHALSFFDGVASSRSHVNVGRTKKLCIPSLIWCSLMEKNKVAVQYEQIWFFKPFFCMLNVSWVRGNYVFIDELSLLDDF